MKERERFALLRIAFGVVWSIDAYFKWQPTFFSGFTDYLTGSLADQPIIVQHWINLWVRLIGINPTFFAYVVAVSETLIALGLLFGLFSRVIIGAGILFSLVIWSTAEGFGGPYKPGSTDVGAAIIYVLVFVALVLGKSWERFSLDEWIGKRRASTLP